MKKEENTSVGTTNIHNEYHAPVYQISVGYIDKQINGDYYENHYADGSKEEGESENQQQTADSQQPKRKPGAKQKFLFIKNGDENVEDIRQKRAQAEKLKRLLAEHNLGKRKLNTKADDLLNKIVVLFCLHWKEKGYISSQVTGAAIFRFLTVECGLVTEVTERSYGNKITKFIEQNDVDIETTLMVRKYF